MSRVHGPVGDPGARAVVTDDARGTATAAVLRRSGVALLFAALAALFVVHAHAAYWQCDDAYISFRYVWHLVHGNGFVFNVGERVEGYTNFLWVLELAGVWKIFGVAPEIACDVLSILASIGSLACVVVIAQNGPWPARRVFVAFGALLLLATSRTWAVWSTSGLETRQFTLCVLLGVLFLAHGPITIRRMILAALAFSAAELTRPEGSLMWAMGAVWLVVEMLLAPERRSWRALVAYASPFVVIVGAHYLWRHAYYGEWLPNTYYAKYVRPWPEMGVRYLAAGAIESGAWFLIPLALVGGIARIIRGNRAHALAALLIVPHALYVMRIGGDNFELRPLDFYWPLVALAAVEGAAAIGAFVVGAGRAHGVPRPAWIARATALALLSLAVVYGASVQLAKAIVTAPHDTRETANKLSGRIESDEAAWLYALPAMNVLLPAYNALQSETTPHCVGVLWRVNEILWREELERWKPYGRARGRELLPKDGVMARVSTGVIGYYLADLVVIDLVGLTDKVVARTPCTRPNDKRVLAHDRAATPEYLHARGVNMSVLPAALTKSDALRAASYAVRLDDDLWMPFDSPDRAWVERAFQGREVWSWNVTREIGCFDATATNWTLSGAAFEHNPRAGLPFAPIFLWPKRCASDLGLDSRDAHGGGSGRGSARSAAFTAGAGERLELRLAASSTARCGARLLANDRSVHVFSVDDGTARLSFHVELTPWAGQELVVEVFDESDEDWVVASDVVVLTASRL